MKKGFSTNAFTKFSLLETIEIISDLGYDGLEIVADTPHAFLPLVDEELKKIKSSLENRRLLVSNINANTVFGWNLEQGNEEKFEPSISNKNETLRKWRVEYTKKTIKMAAELNAPSVCITSGIKNMKNIEDEMIQINKSLFEVLEFAERYHSSGLKTPLACVPTTYNQITVDQMKELSEKLKEYYLPCKSKKYLNDLNEKKSITLLRQFIKIYDYKCIGMEKSIQGKKTMTYRLLYSKDNYIQSPVEKKQKEYIISFE